MRLIQTLILIFAVSAASGQCKVEADAFTGKKTVHFSFRNETLVFSLVDEKPSIQIKFNYSGEYNSIEKAGSEMMVKTDGGEVMTFKTIKDAPPVTTVNGYSILSQYTYLFAPTKEDLEKIAGSKLTNMRYPDGKGGHADLEFKGGAKKWGKAMVEGAQCLLENM